MNKPGHIVWSLLKGWNGGPTLFDLGHLLAVDNYYTCIHLFYELSLHRVDCVGTVKANRTALPKSVLSKTWKKHEKGNRVVKFCDRFFFMNWMDKKPVRILSTVSSGLLNDDVNGKPAVIHVYNRVMPGIDANDQVYMN